MDISVLPVPSAGGQPAQPFVGVQGAFISAKSKNPVLANEFVVNFLSTEAAQDLLYKEGGRMPANAASAAKVDDPILKGFGEAGATGAPMPAIPAMSSVWAFWGATEAQIISGQAPTRPAAWNTMVTNIQGAVDKVLTVAGRPAGPREGARRDVRRPRCAPAQACATTAQSAVTRARRTRMTDQKTVAPPAPPDPGRGSAASRARGRLPRPELLRRLRRQAPARRASSTRWACTASSPPWPCESWAILAFLVAGARRGQLGLLLPARAARQVPRPRAALPARLPALRHGLHGLRGVHQLRRRAQLRRRPTRSRRSSIQNETRVEGSPTLPADRRAAGRRPRVRRRAGRRGPGRHGRRAVRSRPTTPPSRAASVTAVPGWDVLGFAEIAQQQDDDHHAAGPVLRRPDRTARSAPRTARPGTSTSRRSCTTRRPTRSPTPRPARRTRPTDRGNFVSEDGKVLTPGWRVGVGFENFTTRLHRLPAGRAVRPDHASGRSSSRSSRWSPRSRSGSSSRSCSTTRGSAAARSTGRC